VSKSALIGRLTVSGLATDLRNLRIGGGNKGVRHER
jgi:hypothetical protein